MFLHASLSMILSGLWKNLMQNFNKLIRLPDSIGFELNNLSKLSINSNMLIGLPISIAHPEVPARRSLWGFGKLVKYGTFNGGSKTWNREEREGFIMPEYRSIHSLALPRVFRNVFPSPSLFSKNLFQQIKLTTTQRTCSKLLKAMQPNFVYIILIVVSLNV